MIEFAAFEGDDHKEFFYSADSNTPSDKAAILVHGFPGTPYEMQPLGKFLASEGYDAYGVLLPGFGDDITSLENQTEASWLSYLVEIYIDIKQNYQQIIFVGYSFGGGLIINLMSRNVITPTQIILIAPFWDAFAQFNSVLTMIAKLFWPLIVKFAPEIKPYENTDFSDPRVKSELNRVFNNVDLDDPNIQMKIRNISIPFSVIDQLRKIGNHVIKSARDIPYSILILQGDIDNVVPLGGL